MFTHRGIAVDTWARIEDNCSIRYEVVGDEAQFEFGSNATSLNIVATAGGLASLAEASQAALRTMEQEPDSRA
ncbi:hypothetical protein ACFWY9_43565 [Amycolatopsis sp. NPDC059027]|uniref:hypothetical protein n=1 Tax=unclassified Amycolatopsis TaxID=2618356 RepID=UPI003670A961